MSSPFFMEPQLFKLGFFFLLERRVRPSGSVRRPCLSAGRFASPVRLTPRVFSEPCLKRQGSFFFIGTTCSINAD